MSKLLMERRSNAFSDILYPVDERASAALKKMKFGEVIEVTVKRGRSLPQHRLFWGILKHVAHATEWAYPERLLVALKVRLGRYDLLQLPNGKLAPVPHSISFSEMSQAAFQEFMDSCIDLICTEVLPGYDPTALLNDGERAAG